MTDRDVAVYWLMFNILLIPFARQFGELAGTRKRTTMLASLHRLYRRYLGRWHWHMVGGGNAWRSRMHRHPFLIRHRHGWL